jgi:Mg2+/Co2+ transporter CorB
LAAIITIRLVGNNEWALAISTTAVTFLILIFSEATPKVIGAAHPERYAFRVSYLLTPMLKLFYPVVWFVNLFVTGLLRLLRQRPQHSENPHISPEELRILVLEAGSFIEKKHHSILLNLFELDNITVDDIMVPRAQIEAIDIEAEVEDLRKKIATCHHTRLPVYQDNPDNIIGFIHARKVLHMHYHELTAESLRTILREPYYIPSGTPLFTQLHNFQENQRRIGLVVNEYGDIQGLVTLEDILEEFIGEFTTHAPSQQQNWQPQQDGSILIEGASLLRDLNRKLGLNLPLNGPRTLNGLIIEQLQTLPEADTCLVLHGHRLEILQTQNHAVKMVKLYPSAP